MADTKRKNIILKLEFSCRKKHVTRFLNIPSSYHLEGALEFVQPGKDVLMKLVKIIYVSRYEIKNV